ncbi:hypothetical protein Tco_0885095 [Tanacetum coccineum]
MTTTRQCARWTRDDEILLTQCWIATSENGQIKADRSEDSFWGQIMDDFNSGTTQGYRTRNMLTRKWTMINGQKFNAIYKHLAAQQPKGREFTLEHARRILKGHSKWEASKFSSLIGGSASGSISDSVSEELRHKLQGTSAYEAKKQKEMAIIEFKEMEFLTIDPDKLAKSKASIIRKKQEQCVRTDNQEKDEKQRQNDKTGLGMEKTVKDKAKSKPESQSSQKVNRKVNWSKPKSTPKPKSQHTKKYKFRD